jgi:hypothetical protein
MMRDIEVTKTRNGWVIEWTGYSPGYEACVQGAISGRRCLYKRSTLARLGIGYEADPYASAGCDDPWVTNVELLAHQAEPDRVLSKGHYIA